VSVFSVDRCGGDGPNAAERENLDRRFSATCAPGRAAAAGRFVPSAYPYPHAYPMIPGVDKVHFGAEGSIGPALPVEMNSVAVVAESDAASSLAAAALTRSVLLGGATALSSSAKTPLGPSPPFRTGARRPRTGCDMGASEEEESSSVAGADSSLSACSSRRSTPLPPLAGSDDASSEEACHAVAGGPFSVLGVEKDGRARTVGRERALSLLCEAACIVDIVPAAS
jgi:hypothetical protein